MYQYHTLSANPLHPDGTKRYICDAWGMEKYYGENLFGWDISELLETPVLSRVFIAIRWTATPGSYYSSPIPVDIYIGGFKCNSASLQLDGTTEDTQFYLFELDGFNELVGNIEKGARWSIEMGTTLGLRISLCKGIVNG